MKTGNVTRVCFGIMGVCQILLAIGAMTGTEVKYDFTELIYGVAVVSMALFPTALTSE